MSSKVGDHKKGLSLVRLLGWLPLTKLWTPPGNGSTKGFKPHGLKLNTTGFERVRSKLLGLYSCMEGFMVCNY